MRTSIFGLSGLPVETIGDVIKPNSNSKVPEPKCTILPKGMQQEYPKIQGALSADVYSSSGKVKAFIKMRNGFGKLMSHFSKVKIK